MEGPHWFLMVCPWSAKIIHQTWSKNCEERANIESSSDYDNSVDNADCSEHWSARSSSGRTSSPANKLVDSSLVPRPSIFINVSREKTGRPWNVEKHGKAWVRD